MAYNHTATALLSTGPQDPSMAALAVSGKYPIDDDFEAFDGSGLKDLERRCRIASDALDRANTARAEATRAYLVAKAQCADARREGCDIPANRCDSHDPFAVAEADVRRARFAYCLALEQNSLVQRLMRDTRAAYLAAEERLGSMARAEAGEC